MCWHANTAGLWPGLLPRVGDPAILQAVPLALDPHALVFEAWGDVQVAHDGTWLGADAGCQVRLNGVFASFAETYWQRHTHVRQVQFALSLTGEAALRVFRRDVAVGADVCVFEAWYRFAEPHDVTVPITLADQGETLLWAELSFRDASTIANARWEAEAAPLREPSLCAVICTFNRDADLIANFAALQRCVARPFDRIVVVNQGAPGLAQRLDAAGVALAGVALDVVEQANLGGAGGFTRGMMAALDGAATHIVLMDDDIAIEPMVLQRLRAIYRYATTPLCIGGAMFDLFARTRLTSAGDMIHPSRPEIITLRDPWADDARDPATRDYIARHRTPDFNAWWCLAIPREVVEAQGLPLPLFIRGDDVEYGYRLTQAGVPTLCWPGVAVWHRPFSLKSHAWHYFYDRRNSLFLCEMHGRFTRWHLAGMIIGSFFSHLLRYDYARAEMLARGLAAFNRGPAGLLAWSADDHVALTRPVPQEYREAGRPLPRRCTQMRPAPAVRPRGAMLRQVLVDLFAPMIKFRHRFGFIRAEHLTPFAHPRPRILLIRRPNMRKLEMRRYKWLRGWRLTAAFAWQLAVLLLLRPLRPAALKALITPAAWQSYLRRHQ